MFLRWGDTTSKILAAWKELSRTLFGTSYIRGKRYALAAVNDIKT
jgi:hypothetical protein